MSDGKNNSAGTKKMMDDLQDKLDFAMYEQEEMDPEKVKEILAQMEKIDPEAERVKAEFNKDRVWEEIKAQCNAELAKESMPDADRVKAGMVGARKRKSVASAKSGKVRKFALVAATIVFAVFLGANIGTYATEKKNVIEYMQDLSNGTSFWVTGDAPSMEFEKGEEIYYSWNDVPNEYKEFLIIPQGLPDDMGLYDIKIIKREIFQDIIMKYIDDDAKSDFLICIAAYQNEELSFANLKYDGEYEYTKQKIIEGTNLNYYFANENEVVAQFAHGKCVYTINGKMDTEMMMEIVEQTIENAF